MPLSSLLILSLLAAVGPEVQVQTSDQQTIQGTLTGIDEAGLAVRVGQQDRRFALNTLLSVSLPASSSLNPEKYNTLVELTDRSLLAATDYQVTGDAARVVLVGGARVEVPTRAIRSVRFQAAGERDEKSNKQWSEIVESKATADLLVVRKKGSLDYLEGVLQDLNSESLKFELDREPINVKRPKIEGLVYYHSAGEALPEPICEVSAIGGTRLSVRSVRLSDGQFKIVTTAGASLTFQADQASELDFSAGKVRYLSDLETETAEYTPFFATKEPLPVLMDFFRLRQDVGLEQGPLKLDGKTFRKGLAVHSRSRLAYRLPGEFNRLTAVVGIDDNVREGGNARLEIKGDGRSLWQGTVRGTEPAQNVDIAVAGVRRLEIIVDYGDDLDIADHVDLCDAKVTK
jgi:hypothetical protein